MSNENVTLLDIQTLGDYANAHDMDTGALRRYVRKNPGMDGATKFGDRWYINRNADIVLPETKPRGKSRSDGRQRFVVYVDPKSNELDRIVDIVGITNVLDPRVRARERRAAAAKCYFCDNPASQPMDCDDGETHDVCDGCADAWTNGDTE